MAAWATIQLARSLAEQGDLEQSGRLLGAGIGFLETAGAGRDWMDEACEAAVYKILHDQLEAETVEALLDEGHNLGLEDAVHSVLSDSTGGAEIRQERSAGLATHRQRS
jgi:hypothetical protein